MQEGRVTYRSTQGLVLDRGPIVDNEALHRGQIAGIGRSALFRVCAWCDIFMGITSPVEDERVTHGMCSRCAERVQRREGRWDDHALIIVQRSQETLYRHLTVAFEHLPCVSVRLDQRQGERRREPQRVDTERRRHNRRRAPLPSQRESWAAIGVQVVYTEPPGRLA